MAKPVVSESALRELLREALDNDGAMGHDASAPAVTPNPSMDRPSIQLDINPIEVRHVPRSKNELIVMVRNLLDTVDDDQSGELYKKIKSLIGGDEVGKKDFGRAREQLPADRQNATNDRNIDMKNMKNVGEGTLADAIRSIVEEAMEESEQETDVCESDDEEGAPNTVRGPTWGMRPNASEEAPETKRGPTWGMRPRGHDEPPETKRSSRLGEAIMLIAAEALEEAKKKNKNFDFKKFAFKKKGKKAVDEADALPTKGKKKTKTSDFGGGSTCETVQGEPFHTEISEAIRFIAAEALAEAPIRINTPGSYENDPNGRDTTAQQYRADRAGARAGDEASAKSLTLKNHFAGAPKSAEKARQQAGKIRNDKSMGSSNFGPTDEMDELDEANYDAAMAEAEGGEHKLPWGFGKGKFMASGGFDKSLPGDDEFEGPPSDTFAVRGGLTSDEFGGPKGSTPLWDPNEDIIDDEEREAALAALTKSAWDPDDDEDEDETPVHAGKKSPKPRIDVGTGYGVEGDTFEKIGEKLGFTKEAAKKAVEVAQERFKVLHDMEPDELAELVMTGVDEYIGMLTKTGELDAEEVKYLHDNADKVEDSEEFREFFSKFVKRAAREKRADTQDDNND